MEAEISLMKCKVTWTEREQSMPSYEVAERSKGKRGGPGMRAKEKVKC